MKYLPHAVWILLLVFLGVILGQNLVGWALTILIAFLIFPKFWEHREEQGKRGFAGGRTVTAVLFSVVMAYAAWTHGGNRSLFAQSEMTKLVAANLRDPSSAEFRNVVESASATCGEVNGKNAFGAYAGFKPFVYEAGNVQFEPDSPVGADVPAQTAYLQELAQFKRAQRLCYD